MPHGLPQVLLQYRCDEGDDLVLGGAGNRLHLDDVPHHGDADKLGEVFHPSADLRSLENGELRVLHLPAWLNWMRKQPSAKAEGKPREDFIVTIDRSDEQTAFIKVRCQLPPRYFTDYLVAMKLSDGWKIVSKSYRYDLRE